jgi:HEAT repeat protein
MKFPRDFADISVDMGQTDSGKTLPPILKPDALREQLSASDAACIAGWIDAVVRTIEGRRTHPLDDSALHKIQTDLEAATRSCLDQVGDFSIRVEESDLFFEDHCIYHNAAPEGSLSIALYRDGIREIALRLGVQPEELSAFVDILERVTAGWNPDSEDAVTLLWEGDFQHVRYACVPLEDWNTEPRTEDEALGSAEADAGIPWPADGETGSNPGQPAEGRSDDWALVDDPAASGEPLPPQSNLTEIEAHNICMVASIEDALSPRDRILEILWSLLASEENPAMFSEVASSLGRLIERAFVAADMKEAGDLSDRLRSASDSKTTGRSEFQSATNRVLQHVGRSELLGRLGTILKRHPDIDLAALTRFLAQLGPSAAPTLCTVLGEIEEMKARRAICEALVISCRSHVGILLDRLSDPRWYVVRNILYILGRIAHQGVERALGDALTHTDVRVRKEAVRALGGIDSPASRAYLNSALRDSDKSIRILVAQELASRKDERAARILWSVIEAPEFPGRDVEERVAFCGALGRAGSDALIPKMERMLTRGGMFQPADQGGRKEAAMALAWLGTPAALDVLSREAKSKNDAVRRAVTEALGTLREFAPKSPKKD